MEWKIDIKKGNTDKEREVSVYWETNTFALESWGWYGNEKLILFTPNLCAMCNLNAELEKKIAETVCNFLNENNITPEYLKNENDGK